MTRLGLLLLMIAITLLSCKQAENKSEETAISDIPANQEAAEQPKENIPLVTTEDIQFDEGSRSTLIKGKIVGRDKRIYYVQVKEGETLQLELYANNPETLLSVFNPKGSQLHEGQVGKSEIQKWEDTAAEGGRYIVMVRLSSEAGHQGYATIFDLKVDLL